MLFLLRTGRTSRPLRPYGDNTMTITFTHQTRAVLQRLGSDFMTYPAKSLAHDRRVTPDGDIVFDIRDLWDFQHVMTFDLLTLEPGTSFGEFLDEEVLDRWAVANRFPLDYINPVDVLYRSIHALILPTIAESRHARVKQGARKAMARQGTRDSLPLYQLRVDRRAFRKFLIDMYGPELQQVASMYIGN